MVQELKGGEHINTRIILLEGESEGKKLWNLICVVTE